MWEDRRREAACLAIGTLVLGWAVLAFGSPMDFYTDEYVWPLRTVAVWATGVGAIICLVLLPGTGLLPRVPVVLAVAGGFLLLYGWFMAVNAHSEHSLDAFFFTMIEKRPVGWAPGSIARATSLRSMVELTFVLLAVLVALRLGEGSAWRSLLGLIAVMGAVVALVGMFHKAAAAPTVWWVDGGAGAPRKTIFAPFIYNANAGAYMNLSLPLAMGLCLSWVGDDRGRSAGVFWAIVSVVITGGVIVAASKGALIVLAISLPTFLVWNRRRLRMLVEAFIVQRGRRFERILMLLALFLLLASLVAIGITFVMQRWENFVERFNEPSGADITGRARIIKLMARMASWEEGGWHGFGPGTFQHLVPYFTVDADVDLEGRWMHGHSDPLQTTVEWGWIGAAAWLVVGGGAVVSAFLLLRRKRLLAIEDAPVVRGAILALVLVGLHSCIDFPLSIYSIHLNAMLVCGVCWGLFRARRTEVDALLQSETSESSAGRKGLPDEDPIRPGSP